MAEIIIKNGGALTTVQDLGRVGHQHMGMPVAGVMDNFAARCANLLVGGSGGEALLEATLLGPELEFGGECLICVTGADMKPVLNGVPINMWKAYQVKSGDVLKLNGAVSGVRSYIAVSGGVDVEVVLGSRSTYLKGGIGGFHGRQLKAGDVVGTIISNNEMKIAQLPENLLPEYGDEINVRACLGPYESFFAEEGIESFFSQTYKVGARSDRMGIFMEGDPIKLSGETTDILSSAILMGSIQVSSDAMPIVLMADRQTTGGYAQIATVITADLWKLAQARPGCKVNFTRVSVDEAAKILADYEGQIGQVKLAAEEGRALQSVSYRKINIAGGEYSCIIEEVI